MRRGSGPGGTEPCSSDRQVGLLLLLLLLVPVRPPQRPQQLRYEVPEAALPVTGG